MTSYLYQGRVSHYRKHEAVHRFAYKTYMAYLDLDEIEDHCDKTRFLAFNRFNVCAFYNRDHIKKSTNLKHSIIEKATSKLPHLDIDKVYLLTQFRHMHYVFNPLSVYYLFNKTGDLVCYVLEVSNTPWLQKHHYVVEKKEHTEIQPKSFHVSPFLDMAYHYHLKLNKPGATLSIQIRNKKKNHTHFSAQLMLHRYPFTQEQFNKMLRMYGFMTWKTTFRIYIQSIRLWLKHATYYPHPNKKDKHESTK